MSPDLIGPLQCCIPDQESCSNWFLAVFTLFFMYIYPFVFPLAHWSERELEQVWILLVFTLLHCCTGESSLVWLRLLCVCAFSIWFCRSCGWIWSQGNWFGYHMQAFSYMTFFKFTWPKVWENVHVEHSYSLSLWTIYMGTLYIELPSIWRSNQDSFYFFQPYDFLSLIPIIQGAGGAITDWEGDELYWEALPNSPATSNVPFF